MNKKPVYLVLVLTLLCLGSFRPFGCKAPISGTVTDAETGAPVEGVTVSCEEENTAPVTTEADGSFTFDAVPYGQYVYTATCDGYIPNTNTVTVNYWTNGVFSHDIDSCDIAITAINPNVTTIDCSDFSELLYSKFSVVDSSDVLITDYEYNGVSEDYDFYLKRWDGSNWLVLGGILHSGDTASSWSVYPMYDFAGNPVRGEGSYYKWNGISWDDLGVTGSGSNSSAIQDENNIIKVWDVDLSPFQIYLEKWNGASWVELSTGSASGSGISNTIGNSRYPSVALDASGYPIVAWSDTSAAAHSIYVKKYDGNNWVEIAGSATGDGLSESDSNAIYSKIAVNSSGVIAVLWEEGNPVNRLYLKKYDGDSWIDVDDFQYLYRQFAVSIKDNGDIFVGQTASNGQTYIERIPAE